MSTVHVGTPAKEWENWESHIIHFHNFESMPTKKKGHMVTSPTFSCYNHEWRLRLYPGGREDTKDGMVGLFLVHRSDHAFSATFSLLVRDACGKIMFHLPTVSHNYQGKEGYGYLDFLEHSEIIKVLSHGTLTVEVRIKPDNDRHCTNFIPKNEFAQNMANSFLDETTADVIFEVKGQGESTGVQFHTHKLVLQLCAKGSTLASLCEGCDKSTPVPILDVDPQVFRQMLYYVYGGNIEAAEWKEKAKDYINAADRYGVKNLKIEAEAWYVKHLEITLDNVIEELHYAEEKNCFLLKEMAMDFILKNADEVLASDSFENIPQSTSIMREIVSLVAMNNKVDAQKDPDDPRNLSINELRAKVYAKGKDIDAPRKRLIAQLEPKKKKLKASEDELSQE